MTVTTLSRTDPPTLPLPGDLYDVHPYVDNEWGACLGCGHDALASCHDEQRATTSAGAGSPLGL